MRPLAYIVGSMLRRGVASFRGGSGHGSGRCRQWTQLWSHAVEHRAERAGSGLAPQACRRWS